MARGPILAIETVVRRIEPAGEGIRHFTLEDPDRWELPPARPGAHIDVHLPGGLLRTYSLLNGPQVSTRYEIAVKREIAGRGGSILLHDRVAVGDTLGVSLPRGGFLLPPVTRHVFIAGGVGVTPFLSAAAALLHRGERDFMLHVVARGELPLARLLDPLREQGLATFYDSTRGRPHLSEFIPSPAPHIRLFCCGPSGMLDAFEAATRNWPPDQLHIERFVPPPLAIDPNARPYTLVLARSGRTLDVPAGQPMLAAIAACGVQVPTSCGGGICGACRVDVLEGNPLHHDRFLSPAERQKSLLACVAGCAGGRLVLDL
jgi:vanillate O-demethylase ferredoxin subunit